MHEQATVLVVEDDPTLLTTLTYNLLREGYRVLTAADGEAGLALARQELARLDLVVLDLMLPKLSGLQVLRHLRAESDIPILILSARGEEQDRIVGLELGADDYVVKPFGFRELVARIKAVTRRRQAPPEGRVAAGGLEVDRRTRRALLHGRQLDLTPKEFDVLAVLAEDPGAVVPRQQLLERVWGHAWYGPTKTLDVHLAAIRKKLGDPRWIETVRGVGFRLNPLP